MSMLKKTAALTVSAVLLLQPMTASAVTWNNIVDGLRNSGSNRYTEDGTTIEKITIPCPAERLTIMVGLTRDISEKMGM